MNNTFVFFVVFSTALFYFIKYEFVTNILKLFHPWKIILNYYVILIDDIKCNINYIQ